MTTRRNFTSILLVAFVILFLVGDLSYAPVGAVPQPAIVVYDHGLAEGVKWTQQGKPVFLNRTSTFTQDEASVYAFVQAAFYTANFTWEWFTPTGELYANQSSGQQECITTPCTLLTRISLRDTYAATQIGAWRMDLLADGFKVYSEYFSISSVITEDDYWSFVVTQSAPPRVHVDLVVTIHPSNQTWESYLLYGLTSADNFTAYELQSHLKLDVTNSTNGRVVVDFGSAKQDGYSFVLSFDLKYVLASLGQWSDGIFALSWQEYGWMRSNHFHSTPESFNIKLPGGARVVDLNALNMLAFDYNMTDQPSPLLSFNIIRPPAQSFGWTLIYRDYAFRDSHPSTPAANPTLIGLPSLQIPILPLTLSNLSLWSAVMSVFMLTGSELLSPIYAKTNIVINRRRLRIGALVLVLLFLSTTAYQILSSNMIATR